ncbi:MAG TPA: Npt1/Npt2 family nucleotide transporter [Vicinamibacterales bacterium]
MLARVRRFFDIRPGETLPVLATFLYIAVVISAYLLAKAIRSGLFLREYGAYALPYVYAAVPLAVSAFVPISTRLSARYGQRSVAVWTLLFFAGNVILFWYGFRTLPGRLLPAVLYVWVNCFGIIAPVQAWSFANSLFDTRQAKRLFGVIGAGASLGAILGGLLARVLVRRVGGPVNLLLVLAALILVAAGIVAVANIRVRRPGLSRQTALPSHVFSETLREIARTPYLRLIAITVFLVAISTQWSTFQLNLVADERLGGDAGALTRFFGTFNFVLGIVSFVVQLTLTATALRRFGVAFTIMLLPIALFAGSVSILLFPIFWTVLTTNALDQGLRFSVDKATYELLYLPIAQASRARVKNAIDIVLNRMGDGVGAVVLGIATHGFGGLPGLNLGLRGTAAINVVLLACWCTVAWRLRGEYVRTIRDTIHRHRLDAERAARAMLDRSAVDALGVKLNSSDPQSVIYALSLLEEQRRQSWRPRLRELLGHPQAEIRRRALALLSADGDRAIASVADDMLRDPDAGVRTEALLYLSRELGVDPLAKIQELGDFPDFSIRAAMAAFLASPGPSRNLVATRAIVEQMINSEGPSGVLDRIEAARVLALAPDGLGDLLARLLRDEEVEVARQAIAGARLVRDDQVLNALIDLLGRPELTEDVADALSRHGTTIVPRLKERLLDDRVSIDVRREIPLVLLRIGTPEAGRALVDSLMEGDATVRYRVIASLNKLKRLHPDVTIDHGLVELLLAAEIAGHYRSHQVLGALKRTLSADDPMFTAMRDSMEHERERIFRLMSLLRPDADLQDAYVGLESTNPTIRANALEFLDNVLSPQLRQVLVPVLDPQTTLEERIAIADRLVGAPLTSAEAGIATLLADTALRDVATGALHRVTAEAEAAEAPEPAPGNMGIGV